MNYFFLFYPLLVFSFLGVNYLFKRKFFFLSIIFFILFFSALVGLRNVDSSTDTAYYADVFQNSISLEEIISGRMSWKGDYFFGFLTYLIRSFFENYNIYFFLLALISLSVLFFGLYRIYAEKFNKRDSEYILYISIFFLTYIPFLMYGNTVRQGLAVSLSVLALSYLRNSLLIYFFISILALFTHKSAILLLFFPIYFYLLSNKNLNFFSLFFAVFLSLNFLLQVVDFVPYISDKLTYYQSHFQNQTDIIQLMAATVTLGFMLNKKIFSHDVNNNLLYGFAFYILTIGFSLIEAPKVGARLLIYVTPFFPYLILESLKLYRQKKYLVFFLLTLFFLLSFYFMLTPQVQTILAYDF